MTINQKQHKAAAKTLRFIGFNAILFNNKKENQPFEIHIKNISNNELNILTAKLSKLYKNSTLNIIAV